MATPPAISSLIWLLMRWDLRAEKPFGVTEKPFSYNVVFIPSMLFTIEKIPWNHSLHLKEKPYAIFFFQFFSRKEKRKIIIKGGKKERRK